MNKVSVFDKYKQWRQKLPDNSAGRNSLRIIMLGLFIYFSSLVLSLVRGKIFHPGVLSGAVLTAVGIAYAHSIINEVSIFDQYKRWRQKILDDSAGMNALRIAMLGSFIFFGSFVLSLVRGKSFYPGFLLGSVLGAVGIAYINYLVITRSQWVRKLFKWGKKLFKIK